MVFPDVFKLLSAGCCCALASGILTGCAVQGDLERAPPIFGADRAQWEAEQAKKRQQAQEEQAKTSDTTAADLPEADR